VFTPFYINKGEIFIENVNTMYVPIWERYLLTVKEAAVYFTIGENCLRDLINEDNCDFVLFRGKKALIKRKKFEEFLDEQKYL